MKGSTKALLVILSICCTVFLICIAITYVTHDGIWAFWILAWYSLLNHPIMNFIYNHYDKNDSYDQD